MTNHNVLIHQRDPLEAMKQWLYMLYQQVTLDKHTTFKNPLTQMYRELTNLDYINPYVYSLLDAVSEGEEYYEGDGITFEYEFYAEIKMRPQDLKEKYEDHLILGVYAIAATLEKEDVQITIEHLHPTNGENKLPEIIVSINKDNRTIIYTISKNDDDLNSRKITIKKTDDNNNESNTTIHYDRNVIPIDIALTIQKTLESHGDHQALQEIFNDVSKWTHISPVNSKTYNMFYSSELKTSNYNIDNDKNRICQYWLIDLDSYKYEMAVDNEFNSGSKDKRTDEPLRIEVKFTNRTNKTVTTTTITKDATSTATNVIKA